MTHESRVDEVELRRLHQSLPEVFEERGDENDLRGHLHDAEPLRDSGHADPQRRRKIGPVEDLPAPARYERQKAAESREGSNGAHGPDGALQIGPHERLKPHWRSRSAR